MTTTLPCPSSPVLAALVLCNGPEAEFSEELCEDGRLVVRVNADGVGENPRVAAAEEGLLEANARVFDARDDSVGVEANEGNDGRAPGPDYQRPK